MDSNNYIDLSNDSESEIFNENALNLKFSIGYSSDILGAVQNITLNEKKVKKFNSGNFPSICSYWNNL
jgi:hypothetical protein